MASMLSNDVFDHLLGTLVPIWRSFNENVASVSAFDFFLRYLYFGATFELQLSYCFTVFADHKAYDIVRNRNYIGVLRWRSVRGHVSVVRLLSWNRVKGFIELLTHSQLDSADLGASLFVSCKDTLHCILAALNFVN